MKIGSERIVSIIEKELNKIYTDDMKPEISNVKTKIRPEFLVDWSSGGIHSIEITLNTKEKIFIGLYDDELYSYDEFVELIENSRKDIVSPKLDKLIENIYLRLQIYIGAYM